MLYFRFFPGDYLRSTGNLTLEEHGIYLRLLMHQYDSELPLPCLEDCFRICFATKTRQKVAVKSIISRFFPGGINKRFSEELELANKRKKKALLAAESRWEDAPSNAPAMLQAFPEHAPSICSSHALPDSRLQTPEKPPSTNTSSQDHTILHIHAEEPPKRVMRSEEFLKFWEEYPNKLDEYEAWQAWMRIPFADKRLEEILVGLARWKLSDRWGEECYVPRAVKFLRDRRWEKYPPKKGLTKHEQGRQKTREAISRVLEDRRMHRGMD